MRTPRGGPPGRIRLRDGRRLCFSEFGDPAGHPVLYCHGWPGSRVEARLLDPRARRLGARVVSADRPGMGGSDFQPGRTLLDWPQDAAQLADRLGIGRFAVLGVSGGGPYALACASSLKERITSCCVVSGMGPLHAPGGVETMGWWHRLALPAAMHAPWALRPAFAALARLARLWPAGLLHAARMVMPPPDRPILRREDFRRMIGAHAREMFRQGAPGIMHDGGLYLRPWGFALEEITLRVDLWHGEGDLSVPPAFGRAVAQALPRCRARFDDKEGHLSLVIHRLEEILLTAAGAGDEC